MANRMAHAMAKRMARSMAKPMASRWQKHAPNPNPNPNLSTSPVLASTCGDFQNQSHLSDARAFGIGASK